MAEQPKLRILVIDDEVTQRMLVKDYLEEAGHVVRQSDDGKRGLKMATATKPDVVLLDVLLPGIDGFSLCRNLKESPETSEIPVILITASRERDVIEKGLAAGADDFVTKPVDWAYLGDRVVNVVRKARERHDLNRLVRQQAVAPTAAAAPSTPSGDPFTAKLDELMSDSSFQTTPSAFTSREADAVAQAKAECAAQIEAIKVQHTRELTGLHERQEIDIDTIRASAQHALLVAERRHAADLESLHNALNSAKLANEHRLVAFQEAAAKEAQPRLQAVWSLAHRWAAAQAGLVNVMSSRLNSGSPDALAEADRTAKALGNAIGKFKLLAQAMAWPAEAKEKPVCLVSLAHEIGRQAEAIAVQRRVIVALDIGASLPDVMADEARLRYVWLSLLINAIRFTPAGGKVEFRVSKTAADGVRLEVADTGVGIAPARLNDLKICLDEPSAYVEPNPAEGFGFGVPTSVALVRQMGGKFELDSQLGLGTCAAITFPSEKCIPYRAEALLRSAS